MFDLEKKSAAPLRASETERIIPMPKPNGEPTMWEAAIARDQAATRVREAKERKQAMKLVAQKERERAGAILSHAAVVSGRARQLAHFILFETDMSPAEAHAMLDKAADGNETVHRASDPYEAGRASAEKFLHPIEADRRAKQALNDQAFAEANFGMVAVDRRTPREREKDEQFGDIARGCRNRDDDASPNQPGNKKSDDSDDEGLRALGFGSPALMDGGLYNAGASAAARLLGKSPSASASYPAHTALRPANAPPMRESVPAATSLSSPDASYSEGRAAALKLLGDTRAVRAEADNELRQRYADQQRQRAQQN
jgi:hypothetical protein